MSANINELRRDPMSGRWTIFESPDKLNLESMLRTIPHPSSKNSQKSCPFCEGNESDTPAEIYALRENGSVANQKGWKIRVVPDQDPVISYQGALNNRGYGIYDVLNAVGSHEILIEHPEHSKHLIDFDSEHIIEFLQVLRNRIIELKKDVRFRYVLFHKQHDENSGDIGDHAYSHILATPITPMRVKNELVHAREFYEYKGRCIYCDMIHMELEKRERIIDEDGDFLGLSPFAAHRPFETWILPIAHETFFEQNMNLTGISEILQSVMKKISLKLENPGYTITLHNGPNTSLSHQRGYWKTISQDYHWHLEIVPDISTRSSFKPAFDFSVNPVFPELAAKLLGQP